MRRRCAHTNYGIKQATNERHSDQTTHYTGIVCVCLVWGKYSEFTEVEENLVTLYIHR